LANKAVIRPSTKSRRSASVGEPEGRVECGEKPERGKAVVSSSGGSVGNEETTKKHQLATSRKKKGGGSEKIAQAEENESIQ